MAKVESSDSLKNGGRVSSDIPKIRGQWLLKASHITLFIDKYNSYKIQAPTELLVYV